MVQNYEKVVLSKKQIIINNFIGGISWAIGATIGAAIIVTIITFILKEINVIPFIGNFTSQITNYVQTHPKPH